MKTITIDSNDGFLTINQLPKNCIFNKVICGCGGTTIAFRSNENYVICVPTVELITNKTGLLYPDSCKVEGNNTFAVFKSFPIAKPKLEEFIKLDGVKKIMCTYDQLENVISVINPKDYHLLVDEYHRLLKDYTYRDKAINKVLRNFKKFKSYCFMSATPIDEDFVPSQLEGIEMVTADWVNGTEQLLIHLDKTNKPYLKAAKIIDCYKKDGYIKINGEVSKHAFFFINSVTEIINIINNCDLNPEDVKLIIADTEENLKKFEKSDLSSRFTISNSKDNSDKMFTFITCKAFEGVDFFSDDAVCFVVSNTNVRHTQLDIRTDICQIAGRIRTKENPFRNIIWHIFNTTSPFKLNTELSYEEVKAEINIKKEAYQELAENVNNTSEKSREIVNKVTGFDYGYLYMDDENVCHLNDMLMKLELYNYRLEQEIYRNGLTISKAYYNNNSITDGCTWTYLEDRLRNVNKKLSFKEAFTKYAEIKESKFSIEDTSALIKAQPLIVDAYNKLGVEIVRNLKYIKKDIEKEIINRNTNLAVEDKIRERVLKSFSSGFTSSTEIKNKLQTIYSDYGKKAKATDIEKFFVCKPTRRYINGERTRGYEIAV